MSGAARAEILMLALAGLVTVGLEWRVSVMIWTCAAIIYAEESDRIGEDGA